MSIYCCVTTVVQEKKISINQWLKILVTELKRNISDCEFVDENITFYSIVTMENKIWE